MISNKDTDTPIALSVKGISIGFLRYRGALEVILSIKVVAWFLARIPRLREMLKRKPALDNISFDVPEGKIFGIFGINAAGKSTLINTLCGLLSPQQGRIFSYGQELRNGESLSVRVSKCNSNELYDAFDAFQSIRFISDLYGLNHKQSMAVAQSLLDQLGVTREDQRKRIERVSLGTQGKIALVRSVTPLLLKDDVSGEPRPKILLLDEPTLGFDVVSVEIFFSALENLMQTVPRLTTVLATNDPREMAICDQHIAIVERHITREPEVHEHLKELVSAGRDALKCAAAILKQELPPDSSTGVARHHAIDADPKLTPHRAFVTRAVQDFWSSMDVSAMVVVSLIVPNLIGLFASAESRGIYASTVLMLFGAGTSMQLRNSMRILQREQNWYMALETIVLAPISLWSHFFSCTLASLRNRAVMFSILAGISVAYLSFGVQQEVPQGFGPQSIYDYLGLALLVVLMIMAIECIGSTLAHLPFTISPLASYFIVPMIPGLVIMASGVYFPTSSLPIVLREVANANPATYGAIAVDEFFGLNTGATAPLTTLVHEIFPNVSYGYCSLFVVLMLLVLYIPIAIFVFSRMHRLLRRIGRFRN